MSDLSKPSGASDAAALFHPGQFVRIRATGALALIIGHEMDRGTVTYQVAHQDGREEGGYLVKDVGEIGEGAAMGLSAVVRGIKVPTGTCRH